MTSRNPRQSNNDTLEYALIAGLIVIVAIVLVMAINPKTSSSIISSAHDTTQP